ncbi:MAG: hypothetical protein QXN35_01435 [Ignisphaera sp.]
MPGLSGRLYFIIDAMLTRLAVTSLLTSLAKNIGDLGKRVGNAYLKRSLSLCTTLSI